MIFNSLIDDRPGGFTLAPPAARNKRGAPPWYSFVSARPNAAVKPAGDPTGRVCHLYQTSLSSHFGPYERVLLKTVTTFAWAAASFA